VLLGFLFIYAESNPLLCAVPLISKYQRQPFEEAPPVGSPPGVLFFAPSESLAATQGQRYPSWQHALDLRGRCPGSIQEADEQANPDGEADLPGPSGPARAREARKSGQRAA